MQLTVDTVTDTAFQLTAAANFLNALAGNAPAKPEAAELGNAAATAIPLAPANASASENQSPVPAAPSGTPADSASAALAVANAGSLDKAGFPWDARIHTANKATIGDGTWRKKPGVDADLVVQVRAEWTNLAAQAKAEAPNVASAEVPAAPGTPAATGEIPDVPAAPSTVPVAPTLTAQDVLARCTEIQMADASKGSALFQAIVSAGVAGGPMALPAVTDPALLEAALAAVNAVAAG